MTPDSTDSHWDITTTTFTPRLFTRTFCRSYLRIYKGYTDPNRVTDVATRWTERCFHRATREYAVVRTKPTVTTWQEPAYVGWILRVSIEFAVLPEKYPPGTVVYCEYPVGNVRFPVCTPLTAAATLHSQDTL